jgi:hypothetical protein
MPKNLHIPKKSSYFAPNFEILEIKRIKILTN